MHKNILSLRVFLLKKIFLFFLFILFMHTHVSDKLLFSLAFRKEQEL